MQYIQLQGQVAAELDLPIEGSYNLFIDTSDNSIKAKDFEGNLSGGGGLSLTELTRDEIDVLIASASLTPGAFYKITGVASASFYEANSISYTGYGNEIQDGGTTIILQAATDKTLSKKGIGLFYVPNYENPQVPTAPPDTNYLVWDSTSRLEFSSSFGVFDHDEYVNLYANGSSSYSNLRANIGNNSITLEAPGDEEVPSPDFFTNPANYPMSIVGDNTDAWAGIVGVYSTASYNAGDCVIWGGRVWENLSGSVGYKTGGWPYSQLTLNDEDWTKVPFNETNYTIVADLIEYEFELDNISYRKGANNVEVRCDGRLMLNEWGYNMIKYFPWGHYGTQNISISNSYLDAFVNYPHDAYASEIKFADYGGFNAHYWGRETEIYSISSDFGGHMVSLNLGYHTIINKITLGKNAEISHIYTYDNDNYNNALYKITLSNGASIDDNWDNIYMYNGSYMQRLILEDNANITDINLYKESGIENSKLGTYSYIASIALNDYADFRQVELGNSSYIEYINADVSACFKRVKLGIDSYINYIGIGVNGYFKHVEMGDESSIYCNIIGDYSFFRYVNLGIHSQIYAIDQTIGNSYFENINVGIDSQIYDIELGSNSSFNDINIGLNVTLTGIILEEDAELFNINHIGSGGASDILLTNGSVISNVEIGYQGAFSQIIITGSAEVGPSTLNKFKIGQENLAFNGATITSSLSDITIDRGFNNFGANDSYGGYYNNGEESVNSGNFTSTATALYGAAGIQSVYAIELVPINDFSSNSAHYYLPNGTYNGQTVELVLVGDIGNLWDSNAYGVKVWMESLRLTGGTLGDKAGSIFTNTYWFPFSQSPQSADVLRESNPRAIWIQGAWTIDNGAWQD